MRARVGLWPTGLPSMVPRQRVGRMTVIRILTSVLLPAPFGPRSPKIDPAGTRMSMPLRAWIGPFLPLKVFATSWRSIAQSVELEEGGWLKEGDGGGLAGSVVICCVSSRAAEVTTARAYRMAQRWVGKLVGSLSGDDVEDVPVFGGLAGQVVFFFFFKPLEVEGFEELIEVFASVAEGAAAACPGIAVAEQLAREAAAGFDGSHDFLPECGELFGRAEGEGITGVQEVALGPSGGREVGHACAQAEGVFDIHLFKEQADAIGRLVVGDDAPIAAEEFGGVTAFAATDIDGEAWIGGGWFAVEAFEGVEECFARAFAADGCEVIVPVCVEREVLRLLRSRFVRRRLVLRHRLIPNVHEPAGLCRCVG